MNNDATSGGAMTITTFAGGEAGPREAEGAIRCTVTKDGTIRLTPNDVLAALFLHGFGHGKIQPTWQYIGPPSEASRKMGPFALHALELRHSVGPLLTSGGDPHYTGRPISQAEQEACVALIEEMRAKKRKPRKRKKS